MKKFLYVLAMTLLLVGSSELRAQQVVTAPVPFKASNQLASVTTVKATRGTLQWLQCYNPNASVVYIQVFDTAGAVTVGTTVPKLSFGLSQSTQTAIPMSAFFLNAIKLAATTTAGGNTAPGTGVDCNVGFN